MDGFAIQSINPSINQYRPTIQHSTNQCNLIYNWTSSFFFFTSSVLKRIPKCMWSSAGWLGAGRGLPTDEDKHADEERDEHAGAQRGRGHIRCAVAGLDGPICVAATHVDGQCACAAECRRAAVHHQDGQQVDVLLTPVKAGALGPDASCVVWRFARKWKRQTRKQLVGNVSCNHYDQTYGGKNTTKCIQYYFFLFLKDLDGITEIYLYVWFILLGLD